MRKMANPYRRRRLIIAVIIAVVIATAVLVYPEFQQTTVSPPPSQTQGEEAVVALDRLDVKGRAPKTGYERAQFGDGWESIKGCDTRNTILRRDLKNALLNEKCQVTSGELNDPYTGKTIQFMRGADTSDDIQIDHVVALSDAWQKGAQQLSKEQRIELANDPLELLAVDGPANQQKGDGDAATWLPPNKPFRCQYVARQIAVKLKYKLWVTLAEKQAMMRLLDTCPGQQLPVN